MKKSRRILFILGVIAGLLYVGYQQLDDSQKRFVNELARQVPYMIPRYFV
ncbi:MAG: hypothetical protein JXB35_18235 [Anaerolineae bacterium]|nr:hypothetical protein [Anaerolineae bacterium]